MPAHSRRRLWSAARFGSPTMKEPPTLNTLDTSRKIQKICFVCSNI
jgi:hypothetical protein